MRNDFEMIVHELSSDLTEINLYPIGDVHIGSPDFDLAHWKKWKKMVENDPVGYVVMIGDLMDNGLRTSKTNPYRAKLSPYEQKQWLTNEFKPIKDKILGMCQGNHEHRTTDFADTCPVYEVCAKLDIEDLYRENMVFMKINLGQRNKNRQVSYGIVLAHGASKSKTEKFSYAIDGMDVMVTGHIHQGSANFREKLIMDTKNNVVRLQGFTHLVVPSFQKMGGYALKGMYMPQSHDKIPVVRLDGKNKGVEIRWI